MNNFKTSLFLPIFIKKYIFVELPYFIAMIATKLLQFKPRYQHTLLAKYFGRYISDDYFSDAFYLISDF